MPGPLQNFCKQLIWILRPVKGKKNDVKKLIPLRESILLFEFRLHHDPKITMIMTPL